MIAAMGKGSSSGAEIKLERSIVKKNTIQIL